MKRDRARDDAVAPDDYDRENAEPRCWPMIESAAALADVEAILALPTVDGVFVGPSDLSLDSGRIAAAARAAGKPWVMPAWTRAEREFVDEFGSIMTGLMEAVR